MDLFDDINQDNALNKKQKSKAITKVIIALIIIIIIAIIGTVAAMVYLQDQKVSFTVNGSQKAINADYFIETENNGLLFSISDMANLLGTSYYYGEYGVISENASKGYVNHEEEIVTFEANSDKIGKIELNSSNGDRYYYMYLDSEIVYTNGKLYTTIDGMNKILNVVATHGNNSIAIYDLEYLNSFYTGKLGNFGYKELDDNYKNLKALKNEVLIAKKENNKLGVLKADGSEILGAKYDKIEYVEYTGDFIVTTNGKVGIVNSQGKQKISLDYDEITIIDEELGLYRVKQNNKYGVIGQNGNIVIYTENDSVGIDISLYKNSKIKNPYLLFDNCIPVKRDDKWGLYSKSGANILPVEYDGIGCVVGTSSVKSADNVIVIDDYEAIVMKKGELYGLYNSTGKELIPCAIETIYSITSGGKTKYTIERTKIEPAFKYDLEEYFDAVGIKKVNRNRDSENGSVSNLTNTTEEGENTVDSQNVVDEEQHLVINETINPEDWEWDINTEYLEEVENTTDVNQ